MAMGRHSDFLLKGQPAALALLAQQPDLVFVPSTAPSEGLSVLAGQSAGSICFPVKGQVMVLAAAVFEAQQAAFWALLQLAF